MAEEGEADPNTTPANPFQPGQASTPVNSSFNPAYASTPKKNIRFMDESISKIHVYPSLPATPYSKKNIQNYATALPVIPDEAAPFSPILYTFRIPDRWPKMLSHLKVKSPPFYLQLDHAIAVVWCMFCPTAKKTLGIAQIHWALSFLNSLNNRKHERPKDVMLCIDAMEDYLIELYADLSNKLDPLKNMEKSQREEEEAPVATELPFSMNYSEMLPIVQHVTESELSGGPLSNFDDVFRREMEGLKEVAGSESVELMTSKSREAAIDYLNDTRSRHLRNVSKEIERIRSLDNLLHVINPNDEDADRTNSLLMALLRQDESSDVNTANFTNANESSDVENSDDIGKNAE
ncbi:uncharacterized protein LOC123680330 [Harmonia axyridis]|uniref:uncharacterized protein LOC123680330 n=1 Tax=Harmonia axyridis TaxID=115357 RepID=UPI001E279A7B|nr:uncharacterized protein LOC123680330 [Harmonia axyridis]